VTETTSPSTAATWPLALFVALAVGFVGFLVVVTLAFSTHNTEASVHGTTATTSHWVDPGK
jgi:hypothetical protein